MFVYLKNGREIKRIVDVTLHECSRPKCRHVIEDRIDPALWYKVLILDSILVDCDQRSIFWNRETLFEADYIHRCQESQLNVETVLSFFKDREKIFNDGECYDYDPTIDELFDTGITIFKSLCPDIVDKEGNTAPYENLLRMLHVFILPRIKFTKKDRNGVEVVLKWIEKQHEIVEEQIQRKDKTKRNTENSLHEQRRHLLNEGKLSKASYVSTCDDEFLSMFLLHIEKFIRRCNEDLEQFDKRITPIRDSVTKEDLDHLSKLRKDRDELYETIQKAMTAREEIKNVVSRKHVKKNKRKSKKASEGTLQGLYVSVSKRLQTINKEIQDLISKKIKISSVREAVLLTLLEIDRDGDSYGFNCKKGSFESETDLFDTNHKPEEWTTLREKVKVHLQIKQAGFRSEHEKFCQRIKLQCRQLYDESKMFTFSTIETPIPKMDEKDTENVEPLSPKTGDFLNVVATETKNRRSKRFSAVEPPSIALNGYTSRWSLGSVEKEKCQRICTEITEHIYDMAYRLAVEISQGNPEVPRSYHNKVYVCYEEHVSSALIKDLNELYELSYRDHCLGLSAWLKSVPLSEVCGGEMKILKILQSSSSSSSSEESSRECSSNMDEETSVKMPIENISKTATLENGNLRDMIFEELYDKYNKQTESMRMSFAGALDMDTGECRLSDGRFIDNSDDDTDLNKKKRSEDTRRETCMSVTKDDGVLTIPCTGNVSENGIDNSLGNELKPPAYSEVVYRRKDSHTPPAYSTLSPMTERFFEEFKDFKKFIEEEDEACTLFGKLRQITGIIKYIETTLTRLRKEAGEKSPVSADDLMDAIIFLLCRLDSELLLKLYAHMNLMIHLSPQFMLGNAHDYALVTMNVAYQHLFEQCVLHRSAEQ